MVEDVASEVSRLRSCGIDIQTGPSDQSRLWTEAWLRDTAGSRVLSLPCRKRPPLSAVADRGWL